MANVNVQTGANFQELAQILSPIIQEIGNTVDAEVGFEDELVKLGFTMGAVNTPGGEITSMVGPEYLPEVGEDGEAPLVTLTQGYTKSYEMKGYAGAFKATKVFLEWLKVAKTMQGADSSVKTELSKFRDNMVNLMKASKRTINMEATNVFVKGFGAPTAAYGAGSPGGDGVGLFSASHPIKATGGTYSNLLTSALSAASLEAAIVAYKTTIKSPSGFSIQTPDVFTLMVPRALETAARKMLNSSGDQAGMWAGTGSNSNLGNVFSFQGSKVELQVLDMIGEPDGKGGVIGGANGNAMWFLLNKPYALEYKAFRVFTLWGDEVESWYDPRVSSSFTKLTCHYGVDFYNPEAIMGYPGV